MKTKLESRTKKMGVVLLTVLMVTISILAPCSVTATNVERGSSGEITWMLDETGALRIEGTGEIPSSLFSGNSKIKSVTITSGITVVGDSSFYQCSNLKNVIIEEGVITIGMTAFRGCPSLERVIIPSSVETIHATAFSANESCFSIDVHDDNPKYCTIEGSLFTKDLTTLLAYASGKSDEKYSIPEGVVKVQDIFSYNLKELHIPATVTSISNLNSYSVENISVSEENTTFSSLDGNLYNKEKTRLVRYAIGKKDRSFTVPETVTTIGPTAFQCGLSNPALVNLTLPSGLTNVGNLSGPAFENITIEGSEKYCSVNGCLYLADMTSLVKYAGDKTVTLFIIPETVSKIMGNAFYGNPSLQTVLVPTSVTMIQPNAFASCRKLRTVVIEGIPSRIVETAFNFCSELRDIYYSGTEEEWVLSFGMIENYRSVLQGVSFHFECKNSGICGVNTAWAVDANAQMHVFGSGEITESINTGVENAQSVFIKEGITGIAGEGIFEDLSTIEAVSFPVGLTRIGESAFRNCFSLKTIILADSVQEIAEKAFSNCTALTTIYFKGSQADWGKISIADYNTALTNASINFISKFKFMRYDASYETMYFFSNEGITDAKVIVAKYRENRMINLEVMGLTFSMGESYISPLPEFGFGEADTVKVMLWDSVGMMPLMDPLEILP